MNVYEVVTNRIIDQLEKGCVPWQRPWIGGEAKNLASGKAYRGINPFILASAGYSSPYWVTFKQAQQRGGMVRKGEKGTPVVFWKWNEYDDKDNPEKKKKVPMLRYYTVFNAAAQCDGLDVPEVTQQIVDSIATCDAIVDSMPHAPTIEHAEPRAYYVPASDTVNMPAKNLFSSSEEYYSTLFHELTHSTGHRRRLNRDTLTDLCPFGSTNYSKEELVAEMGAAFLCGVTGIENKTVDNSAAYLASWLRKLRGNSKLLVMAGAQAQKAADYIRNINHSQDNA